MNAVIHLFLLIMTHHSSVTFYYEATRQVLEKRPVSPGCGKGIEESVLSGIFTEMTGAEPDQQSSINRHSQEMQKDLFYREISRFPQCIDHPAQQ